MNTPASRLKTACIGLLLGTASSWCWGLGAHDAACAPGFAEQIALSLGQPVEATDEAPVKLACKRLPSNADQAIVAVAYLHAAHGGNEPRSYDLQILLVEHPTLGARRSRIPVVLARAMESEVFSAEAMELTSLEIDPDPTMRSPRSREHVVGLRSTMLRRQAMPSNSGDVLRWDRYDRRTLRPLTDVLAVQDITTAEAKRQEEETMLPSHRRQATTSTRPVAGPHPVTPLVLAGPAQ